MWIDLLIVLAFVAYSITSGLRARAKASRNLEEYFLAGRSLKGWKAGTSMAATQFAADTPLLVMGLIATAGIFALWQLWIYGLAFLLMAFVFSALWRRAGILTDAELTERRYSGDAVLTLRSLKAVYYGTVINCVVLAMVLKATLIITEVFLPWHAWLPASVFDPLAELVRSTGLVVASNQHAVEPHVATTSNLISIVVILAFVTFYSMTGGLRSVVATDVLQFALAIVGTVGFAWIAVDHAGGLVGLGERVAAAYPAQTFGDAAGDRMLSFVPSLGAALTPFLAILSLQWFFQFNSDGTGYLAQRSMACESDAQARLAGVVFAFLQILLRTIPWLLIGVSLLIVFPFTADDAADPGFAATREALFVSAASDLLPAGILGLMLVGMLAALASTLDTHMNWGASYWSNDLYKRLLCQSVLKREPGDQELVLVARVSSLALVVIGFSIVPFLDSIAEAWQLSLLVGAGVGGVLVLRWLWERINVWSEIASIAASIVVAPVLLWTLPDTPDADNYWKRLAIMAAVSTGAAVLAAFVTPRTERDVLDEFYRRVRPPGAWRDAAARIDPTDRPVARLARLVGYVALTAVSLFASLYGVSRLLVPHPEVYWVWPAVALVVAVAAVPLWAPALRSGARSPLDRFGRPKRTP